MVGITAGSECGAVGDYMSWGDMEWNITGTVRQWRVGRQEICWRQATLTWVTNVHFPKWLDCMHFCPKAPITSIIFASICFLSFTLKSDLFV